MTTEPTNDQAKKNRNDFLMKARRAEVNRVQDWERRERRADDMTRGPKHMDPEQFFNEKGRDR